MTPTRDHLTPGEPNHTVLPGRDGGKSQCEAILEHLQAGNTITPAQAYELCGTLALHSRIAELRERGYDVVCDLIKVPSGKHVGCYRLVGQMALELA